MERGFYNEDFEELIKQKADQYRMYPSEHTWKGIYRALHTTKRWYWLGFIFFLCGIAWYAMVELIAPSTKKPAAQLSPVETLAPGNNASGEADQKAIIVPFPSPNTSGNKSGRNSTGTRENSFVIHPDRANSGTAAAAASNVPVTVIPVIPVPSPGNNTRQAIAHAETLVYDAHTGFRKKEQNKTGAPVSAAISHVNQPVLVMDEWEPTNVAEQPKSSDLTNNANIDIAVKASETAATGDAGAEEDSKRINWLQEKAVYELQAPALKRVAWQLSFSPTINYRKLTSSGKSYQSNFKNIPVAPSIEGEPDKLVNHKPALGFELGSHITYGVNKLLSIRAGLQFNYTRYDIQAYTSYSTDKATINLDNPGGHLANDSIITYTTLRNFGGENMKELRNQYFQISTPVGLEMRVLGNERLQLKVAGTIQPTYLLNRNAYLITTDYKNYTKEPSLMRKWNVNSSAEIFLSYNTGGLQWQVGPQFRYQMFSTYVKEYPIREYLMEYGIKMSVVRKLR